MQRNVLRFPEAMNPEAAVGAGREEVALMARVAEGSSSALKELYEKRSGIVYSMLCRMLGDEMEAQECLQDVFVTIWRRATEFDSDRSSTLTWMLMIARGKAWDRLRARARRTATLAEYEREVATLHVFLFPLFLHLPRYLSRATIPSRTPRSVSRSRFHF